MERVLDQRKSGRECRIKGYRHHKRGGISMDYRDLDLFMALSLIHI